jgi:REP element-mobilizing transposase RayT
MGRDKRRELLQMPSTYTNLHYHIIFTTKNRLPLIQPPWRDTFYRYIAGTITGLGGHAVQIGGVADHVHLLIGLTPSHCLKDFMRDLKTATSKWARHEQNFIDFGWQEGYAALTVSPSGCNDVKQYILRQEEHHRKKTFKEELMTFLKAAGIQYDPHFWIKAGHLYAGPHDSKSFKLDVCFV